MPVSLELLLRGGAATTFLLLSFILLRDGRNRTVARLGAFFAISTALGALYAQPLSGWSYRWTFPLWALSFSKIPAFWLFARALFDDDFRMKPLDWLICGAMIAGGGARLILCELELPDDLVRIPHQVAQVALALSAAWIAWRDRGADLVEPRRRTRLAFVLLTSLMTVGIILSHLAPGRAPDVVADLNILRMFVMAVGMALLVAGLRFGEAFSPSREDVVSALAPNRSAATAVDPAEERLLRRLQHLLEVERIYRREGLTIGALAARVGVPEYALRRLINGRLGYRNFNAYLNGWRLAEAKAALRDASQREVPISTIALDAGFSSLGPFNRAFKLAEGMTPSEFRERVLPPAVYETDSPALKSA